MERHHRRRYYRYRRRDRWYFEEVAKRVIEEGRATVDLGVVSFDVALEPSHRSRTGCYVNWFRPDGSLSDGQDYDESEPVEERIRSLVEYTIMEAAGYKGGHIPRDESGAP